ncbi:diguanylate cyclase [Azoarcus indigens]|uniref:Diguanylate cyclase (GGDEF)-like protein n=1 Tax=Azoarcus indigens TaxID=29545 RepID=A0A4R6EC37_9RHOO|nr:diguanylate cyclase [Azoarcus indigens]TDN55701.1 diguanylate cyclase (GGDEF)-like protein [Azoarcus indigens]
MRRFSSLSLRQRVLLVALLPAALITCAVTVLFLISGTRALDEGLRERGIGIASFLAPAAEYGVITGNRASLASLLQAALGQRDVVAAAVYGSEGRVLAVSGRLTPLETAQIVAVRKTQDYFPEGGRLAVVVPVQPAPLDLDDLLLPGGAQAPSSAPVGWVHVEMDTHPLTQRKTEVVLSTILLVAFGLGLTATLALRLARSVGEPVARLVEAVTQIAGGRLDVTVQDSASSDELRALETGFNAMARSIEDAHKTLQAKVDAATAQLAHQALHDPLTDLPNRRAFEQALEEAVASSRRAGDNCVLCFIDLDRFKIVNDSCGHAAGDELLRHIARIVRLRVRNEDMVCRVGGDEFALLLRRCQGGDAQRIAESLREAVASYRFHWDGKQFSVGASIGLIRIDGSLDSASDVLAAADMACYAAKKNGRNRIVEHDPASGCNTEHEARGDLTPVPVGSLVRDRLMLHAQAVLPLCGSEEPLLEVLLRLADEEGRPHPPQASLHQFALSGTAVDLDDWVASHACASIARHQREIGRGVTLSFGLNLSEASILDAATYLAQLGNHLRRHALLPRQVLLEFPISIAEQQPEASLKLVEAARRAGHRVALERVDGNKVGYLSELRPDYIKISFKGLVDAYGLEAGYRLSQALCGMAAVLGINAIASEVEEAFWLDSLADLGFSHAQGRAIALPQAIEEWRLPVPPLPI